MTIDEVARSFADLGEDAADRFDEMADAVLAYQRARSRVYGRYCEAMAQHAGRLPLFLPVEAFKRAPVTSFPPAHADRVFESSRTGSGVPSRHFVRDLGVYERSASVHFTRVFGEGPFLFGSYLPHYAEQGETSSLLYMIRHLIERHGAGGSGSILADPSRLRRMADRSRDERLPLVVFGAAFGLLDLVERATFSLPDGAVVIETGGMKTHRREVRRGELHQRLGEGFGLDASSIRSEYGMCELLSQCYTRGDGVFFPPPWMRVWVVDPARPFEPLNEGEVGALAVLDLANLYSVSAVLTEDRSVRRGAGFEVLGRLSGAELRGCNFLLEDV